MSFEEHLARNAEVAEVKRRRMAEEQARLMSASVIDARGQAAVEALGVKAATYIRSEARSFRTRHVGGWNIKASPPGSALGGGGGTHWFLALRRSGLLLASWRKNNGNSPLGKPLRFTQVGPARDGAWVQDFSLAWGDDGEVWITALKDSANGEAPYPESLPELLARKVRAITEE